VNWHPAVMEIVVWYDTQPVRRQNVIWPLLYEMNNQLHRLDRGDLDSPNDRTERRGRPSASALATDVARPRSLQ